MRFPMIISIITACFLLWFYLKYDSIKYKFLVFLQTNRNMLLYKLLKLYTFNQNLIAYTSSDWFKELLFHFKIPYKFIEVFQVFIKFINNLIKKYGSK